MASPPVWVGSRDSLAEAQSNPTPVGIWPSFRLPPFGAWRISGFRPLRDSITMRATLRLLSSPMKIAVEISGQARTFTDVWAKNNEIIRSSKHEFTFFVDVWSDLGHTKRVLPGHDDSSTLFEWRSAGELNPTRVYDLLPDANLTVHSESTEELIRRAGLEVDKLAPRDREIQRMFVSTFGMLYLMQSCSLKRARHSNDFDWVVRIRPDWVLRRDIFEELAMLPRVDLVFFDSTLPEKLSRDYFSDVCFAGPPSGVDFVAGCFDPWLREVKNHGLRQFDVADKFHGSLLLGESALAWHIEEWRKSRRLEIGMPHAGYILREGADVLRIKSADIASSTPTTEEGH